MGCLSLLAGCREAADLPNGLFVIAGWLPGGSGSAEWAVCHCWLVAGRQQICRMGCLSLLAGRREAADLPNGLFVVAGWLPGGSRSAEWAVCHCWLVAGRQQICRMGCLSLLAGCREAADLPNGLFVIAGWLPGGS